jgi:D-inositol-3-phosphate glycosyltransferase
VTFVRSLAMLSLHSSPLVQPGTGDSGGMNVYVRELASSLAQAGVDTSVFVRRWDPGLPEVVELEPGVRVVHIDAGPCDLPKEALPDIVEPFTTGVLDHLRTEGTTDVIHANYWLSALAGHRIKHELELPLVATFHTLARVKAECGDPEPARRDRAEAEVLGCCDVVLASCEAEAEQLERLYETPPERIEIVPPGVDHAFFSPGERWGARQALGLGDHPIVLFVGRIQPLKGLHVAVAALAELHRSDAHLLVVGGPSGADGPDEMARTQALIEQHGLTGRVHFVAPQPHHLLSTYYRAADVVVVPSRSESFGLVALEAAACGVPVVASAVGGLTTLVEHGRTGLLVDDRSSRAFARALDEVLADPARALDMGAAGARRAGGYRWSTAAGRLRRVYGDLAARTPIMC